ncbi:hypothetical protein ACJROX_28110 [Pseudalkalibacillus sp. A8]|uniref:hypothetical protein n=1 Tax=Pseudalkalibacillus sp. A8 TaxID=3382641 RepID=UPI0038B589C5
MRKARGIVMALVLGLLLLVVGISPDNVNAETESKDITKSTCNTYRFWLYNPNCTLHRQTIYTVDNAELRIGYYQGIQYGWGRFVTPEPGATV